MSWSAVCSPRSVDALLTQSRVRPFSKAQTAMAALDWFANLPEEVRMAQIDRYLLEVSEASAEGQRAGAAPTETNQLRTQHPLAKAPAFCSDGP
jgi:hypothetical protein